MRRQRGAWLALALVLMPARARGADPCGRLAAELAGAAARHGKRRIAVLPFSPIARSESRSGLIIAERLAARLVERDGVELVERTLLETVLREQRLGVSGAVSAQSVRELGRVLGVDAIVTGTVLGLREQRVEVNARLIDAESARVLAAASGRLEREWDESLLDGWDLSLPPVPDLQPARLAADWGARDGVAAAEGCASAGELDAMDRALLDLRARYWAERLRRGLRREELTQNPGSEIANPAVRRQFYDALRRRYEEAGAAPLSAAELDRFQSSDRRLRRLRQECERRDI